MASANSITARPTPPAGHVHLVLTEGQPNSFYLEIPIRVIRDACRHPPKYLFYLGWCVLGADGSLQDGQGQQVNLNGGLVDQGTYYYRLLDTQEDIFSHAVDLEVIRLRSHIATGSTRSSTRDGFRPALVARDGERCVWTRMAGSAMHIIPFSKGDEWLQAIIRNRPHGNEQRLNTLTSINDIRNGIIGAYSLHYPCFDSRAVVVLKTPNHILDMDDVPERTNRRLLDGTSYPLQSRYTLQWLTRVDADEQTHAAYPNNTDAAFVSHQRPKPSDLLLHYNYGAAAVKHWGKNHHVLDDRPGVPRPPASKPKVMGPVRKVADRAITIVKLVKARAKGNGGGGEGSAAAAADSEQPTWDEDDVMLFFWSNSVAARERRAKEEEERNESINKWRADTTT